MMENIVWHGATVTKEMRARRNKQKPVIVWFTGLSGSGKSTAANALESRLFDMGYSTYLLDGDNVRCGLSADLGFSDHDRAENIRRVGEVSKLMMDAGLIVITAFISPFQRERQAVRQTVKSGEFIEVYMSTPLRTCESRDPKGLYAKARAGQIKNFTGIDSPYEAPDAAEVVVSSEAKYVEVITDELIFSLRKHGVIQS